MGSELEMRLDHIWFLILSMVLLRMTGSMTQDDKNRRNVTNLLIQDLFLRLNTKDNSRSKVVDAELPTQQFHLQNGILEIKNKTTQVKLKTESEFIQSLCKIPNWQEIIEPCKENISFSHRMNASKTKTNVTLSSTYLNIKPIGYVSSLSVSSYDLLGRKKRNGGDSWLVSIDGINYRQRFHLVDRLNGSYVGYFVLKEEGTFNVTVYLEYSFCNGLRDPPDYWFRKGLANTKPHEIKLHSQYVYLTEDFLYPENVTITFTAHTTTVYPYSEWLSSDVDELPLNQCGYWKDENFFMYDDEKLKTKHYKFTSSVRELERTSSDFLDALVLSGDSVTREFYYGINKTGLCDNLFKSCSLNSYHVYRNYSKEDKQDFNPHRFIKEQFSDLFDSNLSSNKSYLIINFGLHLLTRLSFRDSMKVFQLFLETLNKLKKKNGADRFPTVIWKTTTPSHLEAIPKYFNYRFLTRPRIHLWNAYTIAEAQKANIPVLDVYFMALSSINSYRDQAHYEHYVFSRAEEQLIEYILSKSE